MAIQQIQKSSTFKPEMIGDLVEVTIYDKADGSLATVTGVLDAYSTNSQGTHPKFAGVEGYQTIPTEGYTLSITHYEYIIDFAEAGDDE